MSLGWSDWMALTPRLYFELGCIGEKAIYFNCSSTRGRDSDDRLIANCDILCSSQLVKSDAFIKIIKSVVLGCQLCRLKFLSTSTNSNSQENSELQIAYLMMSCSYSHTRSILVQVKLRSCPDEGLVCLGYWLVLSPGLSTEYLNPTSNSSSQLSSHVTENATAVWCHGCSSDHNE